jgi:hypothetical protein
MGVAKQGNQTPASRKAAWFAKGRNLSPEGVGLRHGFRSGLEASNAKVIETAGYPVLFETFKVKYNIPASIHTYTLDFELHNGILVETKGKFEPTDRAKHLFVQTQWPDLDIRFVFQRPSEPIYKGSTTSLADWANKHGFKWAAKTIPLAWFQEPGPARKPHDVIKDSPIWLAVP